MIKNSSIRLIFFVALGFLLATIQTAEATQAANFNLCFNPDPSNNTYWPANLVPQGSSAAPYCINQDAQAPELVTNFEIDEFYAIQEVLRHIFPSASLTQTPTLNVSMQFDTSGENCEGSMTYVLSSNTINSRYYNIPGALELLTTGVDPVGRNSNPFNADILLNCSINDLQTNFWLDPQPADRNGPNAAEPAPADMSKADFVSMQLHELLHGFGIMSGRDPSVGSYWYNNPPTLFDTLVVQYPDYYLTQNTAPTRYFWNTFAVDDHNQAFFEGPFTKAYLASQTTNPAVSALPGAPIASAGTMNALSSQNFSHIGIIIKPSQNDVDNPFDVDCGSTTYRTSTYKIFGNDIMTMCYMPLFNHTYGIKNNRMNISLLDYAILQDLGYTVDPS